MLSARTAEGSLAPGYERRRPEQTLLYQIVERHYRDLWRQWSIEDIDSVLSHRRLLFAPMLSTP